MKAKPGERLPWWWIWEIHSRRLYDTCICIFIYVYIYIESDSKGDRNQQEPMLETPKIWKSQNRESSEKLVKQFRKAPDHKLRKTKKKAQGLGSRLQELVGKRTIDSKKCKLRASFQKQLHAIASKQGHKSQNCKFHPERTHQSANCICCPQKSIQKSLKNGTCYPHPRKRGFGGPLLYNSLAFIKGLDVQSCK